MQKQEFIESHKISDALPRDPSSKVVLATSFAESIDLFLDEYFRGSIVVENRTSSADWIAVTPEYAAHFFKTLLCYVYGRSLIKIVFSTTANNLVIDIESEVGFSLSDIEIRQLIKIARNAKMEISIEEKSMFLTLKYVNGTRQRVYALSFAEGKHNMLLKLGEIFFGGAPIAKNENNIAKNKDVDTSNPLGTAAQRMKIQKRNNEKNKD